MAGNHRSTVVNQPVRADWQHSPSLPIENNSRTPLALMFSISQKPDGSEKDILQFRLFLLESLKRIEQPLLQGQAQQCNTYTASAIAKNRRR